MILRFFLFLSLSLFLNFPLCSVIGDVSKVEFDLVEQCSSFDALDVYVPEPFVLNTVKYTSDVIVQKKEFHYFFPFKKGDRVSADDIKKACCYFAQKKKYQSVEIEIRDCGGSKALFFSFVGLWTFSRVKFNGILLGKDSYRQYYLFEPGSVFSIEQHNHYIEKIKQSLVCQGYFNGLVRDYLDYDHQAKSVDVNIVLDAGVQFIIDDITIFLNADFDLSEDDRRMLEKKINKKIVSVLANKYFNQDLIDKYCHYLKDLIFQKGFLNSSVKTSRKIDSDNNSVKLNFNVHLRCKKEFVFQGNTYFSKKQLLDCILVFGKSSHILPISFLREELLQAYRRRGFLRVSINAVHEKDRYEFYIEEGPRIIIKDIVFKGVHSFEHNLIRKKFFGLLQKQKFFDLNSLHASLNRLASFYVRQGFWDMRILKHDFKEGGQKGTCDIVVAIDEGQRRNLVAVQINNYPSLLRDGPFAKMAAKMPVPFNVHDVHEQRQWLIDYFQQKGFLYVAVNHSIQFSGDDITLVWDINLNGDPVKFGKTVLTGSNRFPFSKIVRQLPYKEGDVWSKAKVDEAIKQFRGLNVFETVYFYPDNIAQQEKEKTVIAKLIEDDPFEIRVRAGFQQAGKYLALSSGSTYKVGGSFLYKNPLNCGDLFSFNADVTRFYRNISALYQRPWLFGLPFFGTIKGYSNKYVQPVRLGINKRLYTATQDGLLIGINRNIGIFNFGLNVGFELMEMSGISHSLAQSISFAPTLIDKKIPYVYTEPSLFLDLLDDKLNPRRGSLTAISCKGMFSSKKDAVTFFKFLLEQSYFYSFYSIVFALRARVGHMFTGRLAKVMPIERFFLGGANSLRGYEPDLAPPLGIFTYENGRTRLVPQGARSMLNVNAEMRFPLTKGFGGVVFHDMGILSDNRLHNVDGGQLLASTGFGLRYQTPIGPLRFDIGWKWKKRDSLESSYAWFLTLGNAF